MPKKTKKKRAKRKQISGRNVEKNIFNNIISHKKKWWVFRFNENRRNPTPADLMIVTRKYICMIEVKATGIDYIQKANVRPKQRERLISFKKANKKSLAIVCLYFSKKKKYVLVDIEEFIKKAKSKVEYKQAVEMGVDIKQWKSIGVYFGRIYKK